MVICSQLPMGPRGLNKFLQHKNCSGITQITMSTLRGKRLVIDISIYMYRFKTNEELIENFYTMFNIFKKNKILPLFVFDGKPPVEKTEQLSIRKQERNQAELEYNNLMYNKEAYDYKSYSKYNLLSLKRKKTKISFQDIEDIKTLLTLYGYMYVEADGEADNLCSYYVMSGQAWACVSDDMDLILYGCPRVIRYFSIMNETAILYNIKDILNCLRINHYTLLCLCIISGTDYNKSSYVSIDKLYNLYCKKNDSIHFLHEINNIYKINVDLNDVHRTTSIYKIDPCLYEKYNVNINYLPCNLNAMRAFLSKKDFVFL